MNYEMKVLKPTDISDAMLVSSSVAEPAAGETLWNASTAYTVGQEVIRVETHRKYKRLVAGTTSTVPENDKTNWLDIGPTNRWAMFDNTVGTSTTSTTDITVVTKTGGVNGIYLAELVGTEVEITLRESTGGAVVYSHTEILDGSIVTSFYDWFYQPYRQKTEFSLTDLPFHYQSGELTVTILGTAANRACGVFKVGETVDIGATQYGANVSIIDYSRKSTNEFGITSVVQRPYSKRANLDIFTEKADFNKIYTTLAELRAIPAVYIGSTRPGFEPITIYGYFKDFSITIQYTTANLCSLEIEGLI